MCKLPFCHCMFFRDTLFINNQNRKEHNEKKQAMSIRKYNDLIEENIGLINKAVFKIYK